MMIIMKRRMTIASCFTRWQHHTNQWGGRGGRIVVSGAVVVVVVGKEIKGKNNGKFVQGILDSR